jgi:UDP-glucose 4-epimerase
MNYKGKKVAVTGATGFIGGKLVKALEARGATVIKLNGDTRDSRTFGLLDYTCDYLFHFAAPSSQTLFKRKTAYCIETTIKGHMAAAKAAAHHGIRFIYPSTGLLSSDQPLNEYAMCKKILEDFTINMGMDSLGLRIFASYGPGEDHKADYASVPFLFARDMVLDKQPVIFGDGEQMRDFIFIDDVITAVLVLAEECPEKIMDVGSGVRHSFNEIVRQINLYLNQNIKPVYIEKPAGYVQETAANTDKMREYVDPITPFDVGLQKMIDYLQETV